MIGHRGVIFLFSRYCDKFNFAPKVVPTFQPSNLPTFQPSNHTMTRLSVNINKVALLRNALGVNLPNLEQLAREDEGLVA